MRKQFYVPIMQEQSKAGKKSEINRQTFFTGWLNSRRYRSVWHLFSCISERILSPCRLVAWCSDLTIFFSLLYFWPTSKIAKSCLLICTWLNENIKCQTCEHSLKMYWSNSSKDNQLIFMKEIWRIYWFNLSSISLGLNHFRLQIKLEVAFS